MGLDMYLDKQKYYYDTEKQPTIQGFEGLKHLKVRANVIYWRKSNMIHKWFVDNVQNGDDDCGDYFVTKETLQKLLTLISVTLQMPEIKEETLPTQSGFFFGGVKYDKYYWDELRETEASLKKLLDSKDFDEYSYYYNSSW